MTTKFMRTPLAAALLIVSAQLSAATVTVVNTDGPGEGFNDATVVPALPSNPNTTLGAQRLFVFQAAADQWGALLQSDIVIRVDASFNPLTCSGTSAVLGSAGANTVHAGFTNAPQPGTLYSAALANALSGIDLNGSAVEIVSQFNVDLDNGVCLTGTAGWYYSTSLSDPAPANRTPLLPVVFHELAHGFGFQTFVNTGSGTFFNGTPDIWTNFLFDRTVNLSWRNMSNAQRVASTINDPNLVWTGPNVTADKTLFLGNPAQFTINTPAAIAGSSAAQTASFGPAVPQAGITADIVAAVDTGGASTTDGCEAITNGAAIAGKIALIDRGTCNFTVKVANAQAVGAIAVIIANNAAGLPGMGGADPAVTIPSYGVLQSVGASIRTQLAVPAVVNVTLGYDTTTLAGTSGGFVRMHGPNPRVQGSSVSHFTVDAFPNLLMEPSLNTSIFSDVDLTKALFRDIGWTILGAPGDLVFKNGFE